MHSVPGDNGTNGDSAGTGRNRHIKPSDVFRAAVRELRKRRRWSQAELAVRLGVDRSTVTKLENGQREVTLDDAFAYAGALGAQPSRLMAPIDNSSVEVFPGELVEGHVFRAWIRGHGYVRPDDVEYMPAEVGEDQFWERCNNSLTGAFHAHRELLTAIVDAVDWDSEPGRAAGDKLRAAQDSIDEFARAYAERRDHRPVNALRVRRAA